MPALLHNEPIEAHAVSCAGQAGESDVVTALAIGDLRTPFVASPVHEGSSSVTVHNVTTGALVDVYVDNRFVNSVIAETDPADVPVPVLSRNQKVRARQHLCGQVRDGEPVTVVSAPVPEPQDGISKVVLFNCHTSARTVSVWVLDHTAGMKTPAGSLEHNYDDWGTCPAQGEPLEVELDHGHLYEIVVVDPGAIGCNGQDDPMVAACRRDVLPFLGSSSGPEFTYAVA